MVLQNDKAMKNRMCGLLVAFFTGILLYGQASYAYVLATEEEVAAGGEFIFASHADLTEAYVAKGFSSSKTYIEITKTLEDAGLITISVASGGYYNIRINGTIVGAIENMTDKSKSNLVPTSDYPLWQITARDTLGLFRIVNKEYLDKSAHPRRLQFYAYSTEERLANYMAIPGTSNYHKGDIYIFKRVEGTPVTVSASGYATLYREEAFQMPAGLTGGIITGKESVADAESEATYTLTYDWRYTPGTVVPGGAALILKGEEGKYVLALAESAEAAPADNLLHGTVDENGMTHCGDAEYYYYKLAYGNDGTTLGFWWGVEGGGPFACAAGKAYLAIPRALAASVRGFSLPETVSGMPCISSNARQTPVYDLSGRALPVRGNGTLPQLPRGIYIVGGKKVWVK